MVVLNLSKPLSEYQHDNSILKLLRHYNKGVLPKTGYLILKSHQMFENGFDESHFGEMSFKPAVFKKYATGQEAILQGWFICKISYPLKINI